MLRHEGEELPDVALIGFQRLRRHAPLGAEMSQPARQLRRDIRREAQRLAGLVFGIARRA